MAAIDPGMQRTARLDLLLRRGTRMTAVAFYVAAVLVALVLVRPAFQDTPASSALPSASAAPAKDTLRKGETVATFAARHGLALGDLLALNPKLDSLALKRGTELRIG
jgi:LysM repeat protein